MMSDASLPAGDLLVAFTEAWASRDVARIAAFFDAHDDAVTCLMADAPALLIGYAAIAADLARRCQTQTRIRMRYHDLERRMLADGLLCVFGLLDRAIEQDGGAALGQQVRVTLIARKVQNDWRILHYAEAPRAPLVELQEYYERIAAAGFASIPYSRAGDEAS